MSTTPDPPSNPVRRFATQAAILALILALLAWHAWPAHQLRVIFLETKADAMRVLGVLMARSAVAPARWVQFWVQCGS